MKSAKIMIVDDSVFSRSVTADVLEENGFEVCGGAGSLEEAIAIVEKHNPNIVTMDIAMPKTDGFQCSRELLKINPNLKIIMISSMKDNALLREAEKINAVGFIQKPFEAEELIGAIKAIVDEAENFKFLQSIAMYAFKDAFSDALIRMTKEAPNDFINLDTNNVYKSNGISILVGVIGRYSGRMIMDMSKDTAKGISEKMLRREVKDFEEIISTITEYGNIVCGNTCSSINKKKDVFALRVSPPSVFYGEELKISTPNIETKSIQIDTPLGEIYLNVGFRRSGDVVWR